MPVNESNTIQYTVTTSRVSDGTILYWKTTGNTTNSDIVGGNTGSITITNNQAVFNVTMAADESPDGTKSLGIALLTGSQNGPTVAATDPNIPIMINDTSNTPPAAYKLFVVGQNGSGQLGLNNTVNKSSPTQVGTETNWSQIDGTNEMVGGIKTNGTLWTWGSNFQGQLGIGTQVDQSSPVQVGSLTTWRKAISGYPYAMHFLKTDNTIWTSGSNNDQRLGLTSLGTPNRTFSPRQVGSDTNWSNVVSGSGFSFANKTTGSLWAWGRCYSGEFGTSQNAQILSTPTQIGSLTNWTDNIIIGNGTVFAIKNDGSLWSWGINGVGQLGSNNLTYTNSPNQVGTNTNWSKISAHWNATFVAAIKTDGTLWTWGQNANGALGANDIVYRSSPTQVGTGTNWGNVSVTSQNMIGIKTDGTLWLWGRNNYGQLGFNDIVNRSSPVQVGTGANWSSSSGGSATSFFITTY